MRVIAFLFFAAIMQVSASTNAQKLTYVQKNASLEQLFKEIKKQTGYNIVWYEGKLNPEWSVNANFRKTPLKDVMNIALTGMQLDYTISNKTVVIKEKEMSLMDKLNAAFSNIVVHGRVVDETGAGLQGASVKVKNTNKVTITDIDGHFTLNGVPEKATLVISYLGFETKEVEASEKIGTLQLISEAGKLEEVEVVSTGYQDIPKERATGSFTQIDNKTLNRNVGMNILDRLDGVASGVILNKNVPASQYSSKLSIRGRSTLYASSEPLIVLDGFPYEGTIDQINVADIETIDILKDAAAASIWGTRAGNGVIVLTSKKGKKNQRLSIGVISTITIGSKPDQYYNEQISSSDFIELEQFLFNKGFYAGPLNSGFQTVSAAVEIFNLKKKNLISISDSTKQINALKQYDVRSEIDKYANRESVDQQYQLNLSGGNEDNRYYLSGGYDKNLNNSVTNSNDRLTLKVNNTFSFFKDKLEISGDINLISAKSKSGNMNVAYSPYDRWADEYGNSLPVVNTSTLRMSYIDNLNDPQLLDWHYRPKDELRSYNSNKLDQYRIKFGVNYKILNGLTFNSYFQYLQEKGRTDLEYDLNSYVARNLINTYSSISGTSLIRAIPLGNYLNRRDVDFTSKILRLQLNYNKVLERDHEINAIIGYESDDNRGNSNNLTLYGYNPDTQINGNNTINPLINYPIYYNPGSGSRFQTAPSMNWNTNITQSYFTNVSYSYKKRYILSGSARIDESNLFGVKTNQKGVPLWSTGVAWIVDRENFFNLEWMHNLKLRVTYGYNGNIDKTVSGFLTVNNNGQINEFGSNYSTIANPPNPSLRWEKVKVWNLGLDFSSNGERISGSIDFYKKNALDLIGNNLIAMQSGITRYRGNGANLETKGIDLVIQSKNIVGIFQWNTSFLFNSNADKVTSYKVKQSSNLNIINGNYDNPLEGYPFFAIYSFPSAGLDENGNPQGYLNGTISKDYALIESTLDPNQIKYHGSASPKFFGSLINTFNYKNFELSFNITYKLNYYFRKVDVFSGNSDGVLSNTKYYENRWQKSGDELLTSVPSLAYPSNPRRAIFYQFSEDLVERGDHIRMQDLRLSFKPTSGLAFTKIVKNANIFLYAKNLGILWRKNKFGIDPDYGTTRIPQPLSCSLGISFNL